MSTTAEEVSKKVKEVEVVKMSDGRLVEFVGKRKLLKETLIDGNSVAVRLDFRNGETRLFPVSDSPHFLRFAGHGAEQKYGDETAGTDDVDDMTLDVDALHDRLSKGDWTTRREGGGMAGTSILMKALMEHSGRTQEQIKEFLSNKTQAEKLALRNSSKLKPIVDRLESEKNAKAAKIDTEALFGELA